MVEELLTAEQMKEFDYEQVLDTVSKASKDFVHSGEVVYEAQKQINKIIRKNSAVKKDFDEVIEKGEAAKGKIKTPSGGGTRHETQAKRYSSYEAVRADIMKDINAGRA
jgi:dihydroxyacetone kinase